MLLRSIRHEGLLLTRKTIGKVTEENPQATAVEERMLIQRTKRTTDNQPCSSRLRLAEVS